MAYKQTTFDKMDKMDPQVKNSLVAAGLYFLVANPMTYSLMQSLLGGLVTITDATGTPTQLGTAIHALVFGVLTYLLMRYLPAKPTAVVVVDR